MTVRSTILALALAGAAFIATPCLAETAAAKPVAAASAAALDAYFAGVENAAPSSGLAGEADYRAFAAALGDRASLAFGSFSPEGGGAVARDVVVTFGEKKEAGLKIGELRLWKGAAAAKGDVAAERLDARKLSTYGLEKLMVEATSAYTNAIIDGVEGASGAGVDAEVKAELQAAAAIESYDVTIDRIIFDGMVLHAADKKAPAQDGDNLAALMRGYAAMGRALSARAIIARGMTARFSSAAGETKSAMTLAAPFYAQRGVARGDLDAAILKDLTFSLDGTSPGAAGEAPVPVAMTGGVGRYSITELRLAKLLDYWARGESPPPKETNLLSLGVWESENERYTIGGAPFYALDHARSDLTQFRWLLPTKITSRMKNLSYDIGAFMTYAMSAAPQGESAADMKKTIALLDKHGFSKIVASGDFTYDWAPDTGRARILSNNDVATLGRVDLDVGAGLPTFKEFAGLHPKKGEAFDTTKLSALFADASLAGASITVADKGVLARGFALAADLQAAQAGAAAGSVKGPDLRAAAAFSMRSLAGAPTPLAPVYGAIADFIADGGVLTLAASPARPIPMSQIMAPGPNGEDPLTRLNLTAKRTAE
jgi:hypothetical protein